jgi:competence protein ComEC
VLHALPISNGMERNLKLRIVVLALLVLVTVFAYMPVGFGETDGQSSVFESLETGKCEEVLLCVIFFDIGQGDAIFIESPTGVQMLIDGGRDSNVLQDLGSELGYFDRTLDFVLATHPDLDHIAGLVDVLDRYEVETVIISGNEGDTPVSEAFDEATLYENAEIVTARRGNTFDLGGGVELEIIFPDRDVTDLESNTASIVAKLTYGETEFLLTGDSPKSIEEYLVLIEGEHLESDVLKVGHHGSRTSTSELFLSYVNPKYAIISAGRDNSYGHPHVEVTDLLFNYGVEIKNTAEEGSIIFVSDGENLEVR